ncbi:nucleoside-binding protein [Clostridium cavendishii DSM 21758]|uniref:Nucleoside-binding protein n=1 Tax=Clostridium cavendishii DSM 21758 TaxID=1121302 RepID=A0A1M6H1M7_9CLOT|nr:BMP family ABC transporter substrate-binding protein [Clostridium cavendishii]SHJ16035.1 nucleoside-binding protein [Clostridium cavendishii DSM 21758]
MNRRIFIATITSVAIAVNLFTNYSNTAKAQPTNGEKIKVGMVTDTGTIYDKSFNQSTWEGIQRAAKEFNLDSTYLKPREATEEQFTLQINNLIDSGYNLIVTPGIRFATSVFKEQEKNKNIKFIIVNATPKSESGKENVASNTVSILFAEQEAGFLAAIATSLQLKEGDIGFIGGLEIPAIQRYNWGFQQGIKYANDNLGTKMELKPENITYEGAFNNVDLGQKLAAEMYNRGVKVIFAAAGESGLGAMNEAKKRAFSGKEAWVVGSDIDQYDFGKYLGNKSIVLTSAIRNISNATYDAIKDAIQGNFQGGKTLMYSIKNDGVGIPKENPNLSADTIKKVNEIYAKIKSGEIKISPEKNGSIK